MSLAKSVAGPDQPEQKGSEVAATWPARISFTKDVIGILQNIFAIGAIVAAGCWFYLQRPFAPTLKATSSALVTTGDGFYLVSATATFENVGHVPFRFSCWGVAVKPDSNPLPAPQCGGTVVLNPGEQRVVGDVITVPKDQLDSAKFVRAEIDNVQAGTWDRSSQTSIQVLLFENGPSAASEPNKSQQLASPMLKSSKKPSLGTSNSSVKLPIFRTLKERTYTAERTLTPAEIEEKVRKENGTA